MHDITLILLAAGQSSRFALPTKKQWLYQGDRPLWQKVTDDFTDAFDFASVIVVAGREELAYMRLFADHTFVAGGNSRQASLRNALAEVTTPYVLVNDIARCCLDTEMIRRVLDARDQAACIVPALPVNDTLYLDERPIDRDRARLIQTPQLSRTEILQRALESGEEFTDESSAIVALGEPIRFVDGSTRAHKLTRIDDLPRMACLQPPRPVQLTGYGLDIHPFEEGKEMKLCGITIDSPFGFKAHSDGDVAIHALIDALLGAAGLGDIGELFPDTDAAYAGADSAALLREVVTRVRAVGFALTGCDMTILAQTPRLLPYKEAMRTSIATLTGLPQHRVNLKATTAEKLGFVGRKEGVTVHAVATLEYYDWKKDL